MASVAGFAGKINTSGASLSSGVSSVNGPPRRARAAGGPSLDTRKQVDKPKRDQLSPEEKKRRQRHRRGKEHRQLVDGLEKLGRHKDADQALMCGRLTVYQCNDCSGLAGRRNSTCKNRLCPYCQATRGTRMAEKLVPVLEAMERPALLTLTIKNGHDLGERFEHLRGSWSKMYRRKEWRQAFKGGLCFVETTHSEQTGWHVHIHAIVDGRMPQEEVARLWEEATGDSYIVWITAVRGHSADEQLEAMKEAVKYPVKIGTVVPDEQLIREYLAVMHGRRLAWGWQSCYGVIGQIDAEEKEAYKEAERIEAEVRDGQERSCPHCGVVQGLEQAHVAMHWLSDYELAGQGWWVPAFGAGVGRGG